VLSSVFLIAMPRGGTEHAPVPRQVDFVPSRNITHDDISRFSPGGAGTNRSIGIAHTAIAPDDGTVIKWRGCYQ
jgi:hypothetical protein